MAVSKAVDWADLRVGPRVASLVGWMAFATDLPMVVLKVVLWADLLVA